MADIFERLRQEALQKAREAYNASGAPRVDALLAALISRGVEAGDQQTRVPQFFVQSLTSEDASAAAARGLMGTEFELAQQARRRRAIVDLMRALRQQDIVRALQQQELGLRAAGLLTERQLAAQRLREERRQSWLDTVVRVGTTIGSLIANIL